MSNFKNLFRKKVTLQDDKHGDFKKFDAIGTKQISETEVITPNGMLSTMDVNMISFAFENLLNEEVTFLKSDLSKDGMNVIKCRPSEIVFIPHSYYTISSLSGCPIKCRQYFGNDMHKKLKK